MIYHSILTKSHQLDSYLSKNNILQESELNSFLESIRHSVSELNSIDELDNLLTIFRKWKTIRNSLYKNCYDKVINVDSFAPIEHRNDILHTDLLKRTIAKKTCDPDAILNATKYLEPYINDLCVIDPKYVEKNNTDDIIRRAVCNFTRGDVDNAERGFSDAINLHSRKNEIEPIDQFSLAYSLHGLGNIRYVYNDWISARDLYAKSLIIKKELIKRAKDSKVLSRLESSIAATELKCVITESPGIHFTVWIKTLLKYSNYLKKMNERLKQSNPTWLGNLWSDVYSELGRGYCYLGQPKTAKTYLNKSLKYAEQVNDHAGAIKSNTFFLIVADNIDFYINQIDSIFEKNPSVSNDPYIRKSASEASFLELEIYDSRKSDALRQIYYKREVKPLLTV